MKFKIYSLLLIVVIFGVFSGFSFSDDENIIDIYVGQKINLDSFLIESQEIFVNSSAEWTSSNEDVVTISSSGTVSAIRSGKAYVYVSSKNESGLVSAVVKINVKSMVKEFSISQEDAIINIGEKYVIPYEIIPVDDEKEVINKTIIWKSSSKSVATVDDDGNVEGIKRGFATIVGYSEDGNFYDSIKIQVVKLSGKLLVDNGVEKIKMKVGETHQFIAEYEGQDITESIKWESRNRDLLSVNDQGLAEALKYGELMVKASTKDIDNYDYIYVEIESMIKEFKLEKSNYKFNQVGESTPINYEIVPAVKGIEPIFNHITWSSSDNSIVKVDNDGVITAVGPGIARITGKTKDSGFEDTCSVEVAGSSEIKKKVFVQDFDIENFPEEVLTGEKILMDIKYYPRHATETKFTYGVDNGTTRQFKRIDGEIYFIPDVDGKNRVIVRSESDIEKTLDIKVISPIKGVEIIKDDLLKKSSKYLFYLGESPSLDYQFKLKRGYEYSDVKLDDVKWSSSDSDIISVKISSGETVLEMVGIGNANLILTTVDGGYKDQIRVEVQSPLKSVKIKDNIALPVNQEGKIEIINTFDSNLEIDVDEDSFVEKYQYQIGREYLETAYVKNEIKFETEFIKELERSFVENLNFYKEIKSEVEEHKERLKKLNQILKSSKGGYCFLPDSLKLKNRMGEYSKLAKLDKNFIEGFEVGRVEVTVEVPGTKLKDTKFISFYKENRELLIINDDGSLISYSNELSDENYYLVNDEDALKNEIYLAMKVNERFKGKSKGDIPSSEYISGILMAEDRGIVPESMKKSYRSKITRSQLGEISVKLYEYLSDSKVKTIDYSTFTDTSNMELTKAYNMGFVNSIERNKFFPAGEAEEADIVMAITRVINVSKLSGDSYKNKLTANVDSIIRDIMEESEGFTSETVIWYLSRILKE